MLPKSVLDKNEENVNKASFWKSLSAGEIWKSKSMRMIPEEFVRSLPGEFEHRIVVSVRWGNSWQLWLEREKDGLFMDEEDWNEFVDDNLLGPTDVLGFTHDNTMFLDARIFKNGREIMDSPLVGVPEVEPKAEPEFEPKAEPEAEPFYPPKAEPEAEQFYPQGRFFFQERTTASASRSGVKKGRAGKDSPVQNPERYLSNPNNAFLVRTLPGRNDVLYVNQTFIDKNGLKFGPVGSPITYFTPRENVKACNKIYNGSCVINGWARVCRINNLKQGDSVVLEFEHSRGVVAAVRVHLVN